MKTKTSNIKTTACFSDDEKYRFYLKKEWDDSKPAIVFIGLNPSKATENKLDRTVMNMMNFAIDNNYGSMYVLNLYPFIDKDPKNLTGKEEDHIEQNNKIIKNVISENEIVVAAWGINVENSNKRNKDAIKNVQQTLKINKCKVYSFKDATGKNNRHIRDYADNWSFVKYTDIKENK